MLIPIRCFTCGGILADKWNAYQRLLEQYTKDAIANGETPATLLDTQYIEKKDTIPMTPECKALDQLEIKKMCCRRHMLTTVNLMSII